MTEMDKCYEEQSSKAMHKHDSGIEATGAMTQDQGSSGILQKR